MKGIVASIQGVSDIVARIAAASGQQSVDARRIGKEVAGMDDATQQNAALVEQSAAAADSLLRHAGDLVQLVALFKLAETATLAAGSEVGAVGEPSADTAHSEVAG